MIVERLAKKILSYTAIKEWRVSVKDESLNSIKTQKLVKIAGFPYSQAKSNTTTI